MIQLESSANFNQYTSLKRQDDQQVTTVEPSARITFAERAGGVVGRMWRKGVRLDRSVCGWLITQSLPVGRAKAILWVVRLTVLGVLFYVASWLALFFLFAAAAVWAAQNTDWEEKQSEWRNGMFGYGLYHPDGSRVDPHDPDDEF